ncbi:MAG: nucleoside triphosphate pyrophosphohydrolase family protein [Bacteroidota bacterium]
MKEKIDKVLEFHKTFELGAGGDFKDKLPEDLVRLRHRLMEEENNEYLEAALKGDYVDVADALGDKLYVLLGTIIEHGMQDVIEKVFDEIHKSNMSKLGKDGRPIYREDGKALKGESYFAPRINELLKIN